MIKFKLEEAAEFYNHLVKGFVSPLLVYEQEKYIFLLKADMHPEIRLQLSDFITEHETAVDGILRLTFKQLNDRSRGGV